MLGHPYISEDLGGGQGGFVENMEVEDLEYGFQENIETPRLH